MYEGFSHHPKWLVVWDFWTINRLLRAFPGSFPRWGTPGFQWFVGLPWFGWVRLVGFVGLAQQRGLVSFFPISIKYLKMFILRNGGWFLDWWCGYCVDDVFLFLGGANTNKNWRKSWGTDYRSRTGLLLDRKMHLEKNQFLKVFGGASC